MARLPLVGTGEVDTQLLAAAEYVAVGKPQRDTRAEIGVGLRRHVGLDGGFERHVEGA